MPSAQPSTEGLGLLVRKEQLNTEEWLRLIEARRQLIKPHLDSFTLPELGSLKCMGELLESRHELQHDSPESIGDEQFSLKTQGIFNVSAVDHQQIPDSARHVYPYREIHPDGTMHIWGLTRSGLWVIATINFIGEAGRKDRGRERAKTVEILETDIPTILTKEKPQRMWQELGDAIKNFCQQRERLYNQARNLVTMVEIEEMALSLIPKKG